MKSTKDLIAEKVAYLLPNRVIYWCLVRAFAYTTVHSHPDKTPNECTFDLLFKSWETKIQLGVDDRGNVSVPTVEHPNL